MAALGGVLARTSAGARRVPVRQLSGDLGVRNPPTVTFDLSFTDVVKHLSLGLEAVIEARKGTGCSFSTAPT